MKQAQLHNLAERLTRIQLSISDRHPGPATIDRSIPGVWMALNPAAATPYPSNNPNRATALPGGRDWQADSAARCIQRFRESGAKQFFFWLSESPNADAIANDLKTVGFKRRTRSTYPVLFRPAGKPATAKTSLEIRPFDPKRDSKAIAQFPDEAAREKILHSRDYPQDQCFIAWADDLPVATAIVTISGPLAYLRAAGTLPIFRNRGAQSALIAARVNHATDHGCKWLASETISMLKTSLGNLQRQGFEILFEKRVFERGGARPEPTLTV